MGRQPRALRISLLVQNRLYYVLSRGLRCPHNQLQSFFRVHIRVDGVVVALEGVTWHYTILRWYYRWHYRCALRLVDNGFSRCVYELMCIFGGRAPISLPCKTGSEDHRGLTSPAEMRTEEGDTVARGVPFRIS